MGDLLRIILLVGILYLGYRGFMSLQREYKRKSIIKDFWSLIGCDILRKSHDELPEIFTKLTEILAEKGEPELHFQRALISARLSAISEDKQTIEYYYSLSSKDLDIWLRSNENRASGEMNTPAMDTQRVSNLRRSGNNNSNLRDIHDLIGNIGNNLSD